MTNAPKLIYIAGPFSAPTREGVERNIERAALVGVEVARLGAMPVIPHCNTAHPAFEHVQPYDFWIAGTLSLMLSCDAVLLMAGWEHSNGARGEKEAADRCGMPVFHSIPELESWLSNYTRTKPVESTEP